MNNTIYRIKSKTLKSEVLVKAEDFEKWLPDDTELASITCLPEKPSILMLIAENGCVGVFNESQFVMKTSLRNYEDEAIQVC